jgi:cellulase/cellobiase CelA1
MRADLVERLAHGTFTLAASGYAGASLLATEQDDDHPPGNCAIAFDTSNSWSNGEVQQVTLSNTGTAPISNWSMSWTERAGFTLGSTWSATFAQSGSSLTATPVDYDAVVAPGASITFGLTLAFTGAKPMPTGVRLAGVDCAVTVK